MNKTLLQFNLICILFSLCNLSSEAQNLEIGGNGILLPKLTTIERTAMAPDTLSDKGLMVYDADTGSYWYYNGSTWIEIGATDTEIADSDNDTKVLVEESTDEDRIRFVVNGSQKWVMDGAQLKATNSGESVFIGNHAGENDNLNNNQNVLIGENSGSSNNTGSSNVAVGYNALQANISGNNNTALGYEAGFNNLTGNGNIMIGHRAGYNETGNDKLYIANSDTSSPLVFGDFDANVLGLMGKVGVGTKNPGATLHVVERETMGWDIEFPNAADLFATLLISPGESGSAGGSRLLLSEDDDGTYGMSLAYDGVSNKFEIYGKSGSSAYGPHLSIKRNGGEIAMGEYFAQGYRLSVEGKIACEDVLIDSVQNWPDYVFEENYTLMPIHKLDSYIKNNGHLPNIPAASEVETSGFTVCDIQRKTMEKIEELTLYIIEQQKQIDELKNQLSSASK